MMDFSNMDPLYFHVNISDRKLIQNENKFLQNVLRWTIADTVWYNKSASEHWVLDCVSFSLMPKTKKKKCGDCGVKILIF